MEALAVFPPAQEKTPRIPWAVLWPWGTRARTEKKERRAVAWVGVNEKVICLSRMSLCFPGKSQSRISEYLIQLLN